MNTFRKLLTGAAMLPVCLYAQESTDSLTAKWEKTLELNDVVVVARRPVLKSEPDRIVYTVKNDPYATGLDAIKVLNRIPRVSVENDHVSVAGKTSVRYIVDGHLLEMSDDAITQMLKNLQSSGIEKIELLTTPPARYAASGNAAYISITTRNESLGTRGNLWGSGNIREQFSYMAGGSISHTTRKIEISADASWQAANGLNDLDRKYVFTDHVRTSSRTNRFDNRIFSANGLFRYKFSDFLSAGAIANFCTSRLNSTVHDTTVDNSGTSVSVNRSPALPDNAITLTAFADWKIDSTGKTLSLTYNYFNKDTRASSDVITKNDNAPVSYISDDSRNRYHIHSVKFDAMLPLPFMKMETGAAYTSIGNGTHLNTDIFDYSEHTAAAYLSVERNFTQSFFGKISLRYEHTTVRGLQKTGHKRHDHSYGHLFPSLNLSWNNAGAGRLSLSCSMGISRPNFNDLNPFRYYTTTTDYVSGNPDLQPSISSNAEISYSHRGIYAVMYNAHIHDAPGYITRFNTDGSQYTIPENCMDSNKTGLYASYSRSLSRWWDIKAGGEIFYYHAGSNVSDFRSASDYGCSGKLELNTSWMLNRQKSLILNLHFSHYFPRHDKMARYEAFSLIGCDLRYSLLNKRLNLSVSVNDPFGWNIMRSAARYTDCNVFTRNDTHSHSIAFRASWSFGGNKVNNVYRDSKEHESRRSQ